MPVETETTSPEAHVGEDAASAIQSGQELWKRNFAEREEFFRTVLESLSEGLLITDRDSRIIYANSRITDMTGYTKEELLGQVSYKLLLDQVQWPQMEKRLSERLSGEEETYQHELVGKGGHRHWIQVRATPYFNATGEIIGTIGTLSCLEKVKALERENEWLLEEVRSQTNFGHIIGASPVLRKVLDQIAVVARTDANVLILGESGTGKELVARAIHETSDRKDKPLVRVNCASIPKELFESEFFGHVRGAFTGAIKDRTGRFELADGGTIFLDEIGEIPLDLQSKLLRVLQEGQFEKLGEDRTRSVDVRVIAATNRDLLAEAKAGRFRLDLYYRLSVFPMELPPLRERHEDIGPLAEHFIRKSAERLGVEPPRLTKASVRDLEDYDWPGNVRELQNVIERAVILARNGRLQFELGTAAQNPMPVKATPILADGDLPRLSDLKRQERDVMLRALEQADWKIYGEDGAAAMLGLKPTTLASRIKKLGLKRS